MEKEGLINNVQKVPRMELSAIDKSEFKSKSIQDEKRSIAQSTISHSKRSAKIETRDPKALMDP